LSSSVSGKESAGKGNGNSIPSSPRGAEIESIWKGRIPYRESLSLQAKLKERACKTQNAFFIGFECPLCITLGLRGKKEEDLSWKAADYEKQNIEVVDIKRGGQATLHSPGQLVIYPIMDLLRWKIRPRDFLALLEKITQDTLKQYNISVEKQEDSAGLFTGKGKIAFFGIHISGGVSQHGLAINVQNDLKLFDLIRSCGVSYRLHDSFQNYGLQPALKEIFLLWCELAENLFSARLSGSIKQEGL